MTEINIGDVVQLKSGGPSMTVDSVNDDSCKCSWFLSNNDFMSSIFNLTSLVKNNE